MNEFNWETAEYPCLGKSNNEIVCFSGFEVGHDINDIDNNSDCWTMSMFKPYTPPRPKTKLWYWEYFYNNQWTFNTTRLTEEVAKRRVYTGCRKVEALGFIEVEE